MSGLLGVTWGGLDVLLLALGGFVLGYVLVVGLWDLVTLVVSAWRGEKD